MLNWSLAVSVFLMVKTSLWGRFCQLSKCRPGNALNARQRGLILTAGQKQNKMWTC